MHSPAEFQARFAHALLLPVQTADNAALARNDAALSVYRNTVCKGLVDALAANFPSVQRLVGEEWFIGAATCFAREHPPVDPVLAHYGEHFPGFLAQFAPANELPYLAEVARLDRMWNEAYFAADRAPISAATLQQLDQQTLFTTCLLFHPATRLGSFKHSAVSIWFANHPSTFAGHEYRELEIDDHDEAALVVRPQLQVQVHRLGDSEHRLLKRLQTQATLGEAATAVLEQDPQFALAAALARFINIGVFARLQSSGSTS